MRIKVRIFVIWRSRVNIERKGGNEPSVVLEIFCVLIKGCVC